MGCRDCELTGFEVSFGFRVWGVGFGTLRLYTLGSLGFQVFRVWGAESWLCLLALLRGVLSWHAMNPWQKWLLSA